MVTIPALSKLDVLVVQTSSLICALPLEHVLETMRPLPLEPLAGAPGCVLGVSKIRGAPVPVVDLRALLGRAASDEPTRFVALRVGRRSVALAVEHVLGVRQLDGARVEALPGLLARSGGGALDAVAELDQELLWVLSAARLCPAEALEVAS